MYMLREKQTFYKRRSESLGKYYFSHNRICTHTTELFHLHCSLVFKAHLSQLFFPYLKAAQRLKKNMKRYKHYV